MQCGIIRLEKLKKSGVTGIQIHDYREKGKSITNPDIDFSRSHLNYDLHNDTRVKFSEFVASRVKELPLKRKPRKDAVFMAQFMVTASPQWFKSVDPEVQKSYFQDAYKHLIEKVGQENVVSAVVHLDEETPHLHLNFVPVTLDLRLSFDALFPRYPSWSETIQDPFYAEVSSKYGLDRGQSKLQSMRKHVDTLRFKADTAKQELAETEKQVLSMEEKKTRVKSDISSLKGKVLKKQEVSQIKPKETLTGAIRGVSVGDIENLKKTAVALVGNEEIAKEAKERAAKAERDKEIYKNRAADASKERDSARGDAYRIECDKNALEAQNERLLDFIQRNGLEDLYKEQRKAQKKQKRKDRDWER